MGRATSLETRMLIMEMATANHSDQHIADEVGYSVATVRKWRRRGQKQGRRGLVSTMGRPPTGALGSFPIALRKEVHHLRLAHPGWGPDTLVAELASNPLWRQKRRPSRASVARFLHGAGLTRVYERHTELPLTKRPVASTPHAVWEVDARGDEHIPDVGKVALINIKDRCSRARLLSFPTQVKKARRRQPGTRDYQMALRLAFTDWGLPQRVHVDHASVFYDNTTKSPFPTRMHLWFLALGIEVSFSRRYRPTDQAGIERCHRLWAAQVLEGQTFSSWEALFLALRKRRDFLNSSLPCASLGGLPPLLAFPEAVHSGRHYRPEWEFDLLDVNRIFDYLQQGHWFRKVNKNGTITVGGNVMSVGKHLAHRQLEVTLAPQEHFFICHDAAGDHVATCQPYNLTKEALLGDLRAVLDLPYFQLALPFERGVEQVIRLYETKGGTT